MSSAKKRLHTQADPTRPRKKRSRAATPARASTPTPAQLECLRAFARMSEDLGRSPTKRELSRELGLTESGAQGHLHQLTVKGLLEEVTAQVVVGRRMTDLGKRWRKMLGD